MLVDSHLFVCGALAQPRYKSAQIPFKYWPILWPIHVSLHLIMAALGLDGRLSSTVLPLPYKPGRGPQGLQSQLAHCTYSLAIVGFPAPLRLKSAWLLSVYRDFRTLTRGFLYQSMLFLSLSSSNCSLISPILS